jgi:hypothetical protein
VEFCLTATGLNGCNDGVDCVTATLVKLPVAYAGEDATIGQNDDYLTDEAFAEHYSQILWTTSGDGLFADENQLHTAYTPGEFDIINTYVDLILTAEPQSPCAITAVDSLHLFIDVSCPPAYAEAGENGTICEGGTFSLSGTAYNEVSVEWSTNGDGSFEDPSSLETVYFPGSSDYLSGSVEICLTAIAANGCQNDTDCLVLYFQQLPEAYAGTDNTIPKYELYHILDAYAENYNNVQWTTTNGTGAFDDENQVNPTYQPGTADWMQGWVELQIAVSPVLPCNVSDDDKLIISFIDECEDVLVDAGEDIDICSLNDAVTFNASANHFKSLTWTTDGDGTFNYPHTLNPVYTLGENDKLSGSVTLTLSGEPFGDCNAAGDDVVIIIHDAPVANVGSDFSVCSGESFAVSGSAENYTNFVWTTSGDGTFTGADTFNPVYTPGSGDIANGGVNICLEVTGYGLCQTVTDCLFVEILALPDVFAGTDDTVCQGQSYQLSGTAENFGSINWTTDGDGTFNDPSLLNAVYMPGDNDVQSGQVVLCLHAEGLNSCGNASDCMSLAIQPPPEAYAGVDATVFEGDNYLLADATAGNFSSCLWATSGTGIFDDENQVNPVYTPSEEDHQAGVVTLTLTAEPVSPCEISASDEMELSILDYCVNAIADAGEDFTACLPGEIVLNGFAENFSTIIWETAGDGQFTDPASLTTGYQPGTQDLAAGFVQVCLTAFAQSVCTDSTDCMTISFADSPVVDAGEDVTVCETDGMVPVSAVAENSSGILWTTSGNGFFQNASSSETNYILGSEDIFNGVVTLVVTASSDQCPPAQDSVVIGISRSAILFAGEDTSVCEDESFETADAFVNNVVSTMWTTSGDGYFTDPLLVNTEYIPGENDKLSGEVQLCLSAEAYEPCENLSQCITLTLLPSATVDAGEDETVCEINPVYLEASATDYGQVVWSTSGDGVFADSSLLATEYYPGEEDIANGQVTLTVEVASAEGCNGAADEINIAIDRMPLVDGGDDLTVCYPADIQLNGAAVNYGSVLWQTNGDGSFTQPDSLSTQYLPGDNDLAAGYAEVCLTATSLGVCGDVADCFTIYFNHIPVVDAGEDITTCETEGMLLVSADTAYSSDILWTTSGNGFFQNADEPETYYILGTLDIYSGSVTLTVTANNDLCPPAQDSIVITINPSIILYAGEDATVCDVDPFATSDAFVANAAATQWTTDGDGYFDDLSEVNTIYHPGDNDRENGQVQLCLFAEAFQACENQSQCITLTILPSANVDAGADQTVCETGSVLLDADAHDYAEVLWTTSGDGAFDDPQVLNPEYFPGQQDIASGQVMLSVEVTSSTGCYGASDTVDVTINEAPVADAGEDVTVCLPGEIQLNGDAQNYQHVVWQTNGDGTFTQQDSLATQYLPGEGDLNAGYAELCLTAYSGGVCDSTADCVVITLSNTPVVTAGDDVTICETDGMVPLTAMAENTTGVLWSTSGNGFFQNPTALETNYILGSLDIYNGMVTLTVTAASDLCPAAQDSIVVSVSPSVILFAGEDASICDVDDFATTDAFVSNAEAVQWTTSGDGYFANPDTIVTVYYPGENDRLSGQAELCVSALAQQPCESLSQCITLTINPSASVDAGADQTVCDNEVVQLDAVATEFDEVLWSSSGDGTFSDAQILNPQYLPGQQDIETGEVILVLEVTSPYGCQNVNDTLIVSIVKSPLAFAGDDVTLCADDILNLFGEAENYTGVEWQTSGDGTFVNASELNTVYYPGIEDINTGEVDICLTVFGNSPCAESISDCLSLVIRQLPDIEFTEVTNPVCGNQIVNLVAEVMNADSVLWTTDGDGVFADPEAAATTYDPGSQDISSGSFDLCLTAFSQGGCNPVTLCTTVIVNKIAIAYAGPDGEIFEEETFIASNAFAANYSQVIWTTDGDGIFADNHEVKAEYTPGMDDITAGNVMLTITAEPLYPCTSYSADELILTIIQGCEDATVNAGADQTVCEDQTAVQLNAFTDHTVQLLWSTSGDGTFSDPAAEDPEYMPGGGDIASGSVTLYLNGEAYGTCQSATDSLEISINRNPYVDAGNDQTGCQGEAFDMADAVAQDYAAVIWSTAGDGTFGNVSQVNTTYQPGAGDIVQGSVLLTLTAEPLAPCTVVAESNLTLTILQLPEIQQNIVDKEVLLGDQAVFQVVATSVNTYQWYGPLGLIPDNNSSVLTIEDAGYEDAGAYYCDLINDCGFVSTNTVTLTVYEEQVVYVNDGWGGLSSWIVPFDDSVENLFSDVEDQLVILKNYTGVYYPGYNLNTLVNWDAQDGYEAKFNGMTNVHFKGIANTDRSVQLDQGWNYLPVVTGCPVNVQDLFGTIPEVEIVKEIAGMALYWPAMNIYTLTQLIPGTAYFIKVSTSLTIEFPECPAGYKSSYISPVFRPENTTDWNDLTYTPSSHLVVVDDKIVDDLKTGDIIGAFTPEGICAGMMEISLQKNCLVLYGDDPLTDGIDGFTEGAPVKFSVFRPQTGEHFTLNVRFDPAYPNNNGLYATNGISAITREVSNETTDAPALTATSLTDINVYPNPTHGMVNITGVKGRSTISVYTSKGQVLKTIEVGKDNDPSAILSIDLSEYTRGVVYIRITNSENVQIRKVILK